MKKVVKKSKKKMTIEDLAIMTQKGFSGLEERINERFDKVDERFEIVESRLENLESGQKKIHNDILDFHDTFAKKSELNSLLMKVDNLSKKPKVKSK